MDASPQPADAPDTSAASWRRTLLACWLAQLVTVVGFSFISPFLPFFIRELGAADQRAAAFWAGACMTASGLMSALVSPLWGSLADRYGRKIMVVRAMFGGGLVMLLTAQVHSVSQLLAMRLLQGGIAGSVVASNTLVASVSPRARMGFSLGLMQGAVLLGMAVGPALGGWLADVYGYRAPFHSAGIMMILSGTTVLLFARERFTAPDRARADRVGFRRAFGSGGAVALLTAFFVVMLAGSFAMPIFPLLVEDIGAGDRVASTAGLLLGISGLAAGLSALLAGMVGDRIGYRPALIAWIVAGALFSAPHALAHSVLQLALLRMGMGFSRGGTAPVLNAMVAQAVSPDNYGRCFGIARTASALGLAVGPMLGGIAAAHLGVRTPFLIMSALMCLNALIIAVLVPPGERARSTPAPED